MELQHGGIDLNDELTQLMLLYYDDPILFARDILNIEPDEQQAEVLNSLRNTKRTTVKAGRGTGKTWTAGMAIWWFLITRYNSQVYITAPGSGQISGGIWPTLSKIYEGISPMFKDEWELMSSKIAHKERPLSHFCMARTARRETAEGMMGSHAENMLYVIDEATGVDEPIFKAVFGSLTEEENYLLMLSNPRRLSGFFHESHRPFNRDTFDQLTMDAVSSKFVSNKQIEAWKRLYGEKSNTFQIEVLGNFPTKEDDAIIPYDQVMEASQRTLDKHVYEGDAIIWGLDVGAGVDKSILIKRQGLKVFDDIKKWNEKDTMKVVGRVSNEYINTSKKNRPFKIFVDSVALGKGPFDRMKELGLPVASASSANKAKNKKFFLNAKSESWSAMRDWFRDNDTDIPNDSEMIEQLSTVRQKIHSSGRFMVEEKHEYRKRNPNIGSPDIADSLSFTFWQKGNVKASESIMFV